MHPQKSYEEPPKKMLPPELQIPTARAKIRNIKIINEKGQPIEIPLPEGENIDLKTYLRNYIKDMKAIQ
jgi:hypothetical protein